MNILKLDDQKSIDFLNAINLGKQSIGIVLEIIYFLIFGKLILKNKIYKHHFISLIIMLFTIIPLLLSYINYFKLVTLRVLYYYLIYDLLFCLNYSFIKKYINIFYISPYKLMTIIGIVSCFILLIYDIIVYSIFKENNVDIHGIILGFKNNFHLSIIIYLFLDVLIYFLANIGIWLTIYYFTPFHFILAEEISEYIYYTYDYFTTYKYQLIDVIIYSIVYVINILFCFVFNEIIIIKICNLDYNTNKNIKKREREDILSTSYSIELATINSINYE